MAVRKTQSKAKEFVDNLIQTLGSDYDEACVLLGQHKRKVWAVLARIYASASQIGNDKQRLTHLLARARENKVLATLKLAINSSNVEPILIAFATGIKGTEATRSQYKAALKAAATKNVERTEAAFLSFLAKENGVKGAAKLVSSAPQFTLAKFVNELPPLAEDTPLVDLQLPEKAEPPEGLFAVLYHWEGTGARPIKTFLDEKPVTFFAKAADRELHPRQEDIEKLERRLLWILNSTVLKKEGQIAGSWKLTVPKFMKAAWELRRHETLGPKFFDGDKFEMFSIVGPRVEKDEKGNVRAWDATSLCAHNPDYDDLDPGRYIGGAKRLALVPYEHDPDPEQKLLKQDGWRSYIEANKRSKKAKPESDPSREPTPSLESHFETTVADEAVAAD